MKKLIIYTQEYNYTYYIVNPETGDGFHVLKSITKLETLLNMIGDVVLEVKERR